MDIFLLVLGFLLSTIILVKSSDVFVDASERIGLALRMPHFITGVLIVAIGTSLPELATGIAAINKGDTDIIISSVLGSGISNILLGLGFMSVLAGVNIKFKQNIFQVHFPIFIISTLAVVMMLLDDGSINQIEGLLLLGILCSYLWFLFFQDNKKDFFKKEKFKWKDPLIAVISLGLILVCSDIAIDLVIQLAGKVHVATSILGGTLVAVGTSLPEMVVVYSALKKKNFELAIGNILGSNIFNIVLILGVGSLLTPLQASPESLKVMLPFTIGSVFIYWGTSKDKEITRQEGVAMTLLYILFLGKLFEIF